MICGNVSSRPIGSHPDLSLGSKPAVSLPDTAHPWLVLITFPITQRAIRMRRQKKPVAATVCTDKCARPGAAGAAVHARTHLPAYTSPSSTSPLLAPQHTSCSWPCSHSTFCPLALARASSSACREEQGLVCKCRHRECERHVGRPMLPCNVRRSARRGAACQGPCAT